MESPENIVKDLMRKQPPPLMINNLRDMREVYLLKNVEDSFNVRDSIYTASKIIARAIRYTDQYLFNGHYYNYQDDNLTALESTFRSQFSSYQGFIDEIISYGPVKETLRDMRILNDTFQLGRIEFNAGYRHSVFETYHSVVVALNKIKPYEILRYS